jgi:hypothetical protein
METNERDERKRASVHGPPERVPGALFRAMANLFLLKNAGSCRGALARREVREKLLDYLAEDGVGSEAEALALSQSRAQEIRQSLESRGFVGPEKFIPLCRLWQLVHHEPSSRRLALLLQQKMSGQGVAIGLHRLQVLVNGKTRRVRRGLLAALEELLRGYSRNRKICRREFSSCPEITQGWRT